MSLYLFRPDVPTKWTIPRIPNMPGDAKHNQGFQAMNPNVLHSVKDVLEIPEMHQGFL